MRQYEVTFIVDPVLANDAIESTARNYVEHLKSSDCEIVHIDAMGLRQLAYPINKRTSGVYYCIEFKAQDHELIERLELALRRDERIIRFLTVKLDKYGVKYNDDKRNGRIGRRKEAEAALVEDMKGPAKQPQGPKPVAAATAATAETVATAVETADAPEADTATGASEEE
ncbi:MAG: 30S ribosomal protein S6 [Saprospiraceae bacterium]|nr:30S ribosomal protein S6 [Saprospiraceae bacterium]